MDQARWGVGEPPPRGGVSKPPGGGRPSERADIRWVGASLEASGLIMLATENRDSYSKTESKEKQERMALDRSDAPIKKEKQVESSEEMKEARDKAVGVGIGWGISLGTMVGAAVSTITEDPIWVGLGVAIGTGLGAVVGAVLHAKQN